MNHQNTDSFQFVVDCVVVSCRTYTEITEKCHSNNQGMNNVFKEELTQKKFIIHLSFMYCIYV